VRFEILYGDKTMMRRRRKAMMMFWALAPCRLVGICRQVFAAPEPRRTYCRHDTTRMA
jgi:hypothetical protein